MNNLSIIYLYAIQTLFEMEYSTSSRSVWNYCYPHFLLPCFSTVHTSIFERQRAQTGRIVEKHSDLKQCGGVVIHEVDTNRMVNRQSNVRSHWENGSEQETSSKFLFFFVIFCMTLLEVTVASMPIHCAESRLQCERLEQMHDWYHLSLSAEDATGIGNRLAVDCNEAV